VSDVPVLRLENGYQAAEYKPMEAVWRANEQTNARIRRIGKSFARPARAMRD
jgi:hypothetical protein